jgi:hypothetical protein
MGTAEAIATNFWSRNRFLGREDLVQQARLAEVEAARTHQPEKGDLEPYQAAAIRRSLWGYVLRNRAPVSGSRDAIKACQAADLDEIADMAGDDWEWRERVRATVADELRDEPLAVAVLLWGYKPAEVAAHHGCASYDVYKAVLRGKYRLRQSVAVQNLRK